MHSGKQELEHLLRSILNLYSRFGIRSVTMDDICRDLGMSKKTLYQFVQDKHELVGMVIRYDRQLHQEAMDQLIREETNPIDQLLRMHTHFHNSRNRHSPTFYYDLRKYYPDLQKEWMEDRVHVTRKVVLQNLRSGQEKGLFRAGMDAEIIARFYMAMVETFAAGDHISFEIAGSARFIREIFVYHLHGICNENGLAFMKTKKIGL